MYNFYIIRLITPPYILYNGGTTAGRLVVVRPAGSAPGAARPVLVLERYRYIDIERDI